MPPAGVNRARRPSRDWPARTSVPNLFPDSTANTVNAMQRSDGDLLTAIAAGDREAFAALYDRHAAVVFGLLRAMLNGSSESEDVLQDTFLQAWRDAGRFDPTRSTPLGWLVMMARSRAIDSGRRRPVPPTADPPDPAVPPQAAAAVRLALDQLPNDQQAAIELAFYGGLSYALVAERQGVPVGTAKTRIRQGMIKMRKLLGPTEGPA